MFSQKVHNSSYYWLLLTGITVAFCFGLMSFVGGANAQRAVLDTPPSDDQVQGQIIAMMSLERVVMGAMTVDRLAELGGVPVVAPERPKKRGLVGLLAGHANEDDSANAQAASIQVARRGTEFQPIIPVFDTALLDAMPEATGGQQWKCLTEALYFEARGEDIWGQLAVAEVILNRADSPRFPDDVCTVISQGSSQRHRCQFSYICDGKLEAIGNPEAHARVGKIAAMMIEGRARVLTGGATFYHTDAVDPHWSSAMQQTAIIGDHIFYRHPA